MSTPSEAIADPPSWSLIDLFAWKLVPSRFGGGRGYIQGYKDAWVRHHRVAIRASAAKYVLPPELLAGVCWIEVGGDPDFIDAVAFAIRSFDWSGPAWLDRMTMTRRPEATSFGSVSMQLRTAAITLRLNPADMSAVQFRTLATALGRDASNIRIVARHLRQLLLRDGFARVSPRLTTDQVRIVGARYNRGITLSLDQIRRNTSYGDFLVKFWPRFANLIR